MNNGTIAGGLIKDSMVVFQTSQDVGLRGHILKMTRFAVVFELYNPASVLRLSEVLKEFKIVLADRTLYSGKAVVRNLISTTPAVVVCEATLGEESWMDLDFAVARNKPGGWGAEYRAFLDEWQKLYKIRPEYKLVIADMQSYFTGLRLWLEQLELGVRAAPSADRLALEQEIASQLGEPVIPTMNDLFGQFENVALQLDDESRASHQNYMRRQLHSLFLCAPFAHRTFVKPLGYAGDYEMVNMILRNAPEGGSLFAKVIHTWFVRQAPAEAHRNRIGYLVQKITGETLRATAAGRTAKIFNMACGPANEVQRFLSESPLRTKAEFTLLDFNEETLQFTRACIDASSAGHGGIPPAQYIKKSVHQLLKESSKRSDAPNGKGYDFVYCAGLFDYLSDQVCHRLLNIMHDWVAPGGLLVATNVEPANPMRHGMEHLLDWHLIYRTAAQMRVIKPEHAAAEDVRIYADDTGVNVFLEARKPNHG